MNFAECEKTNSWANFQTEKSKIGHNISKVCRSSNLFHFCGDFYEKLLAHFLRTPQSSRKWPLQLESYENGQNKRAGKMEEGDIILNF